MYKIYLISAKYPDNNYYKIGWTRRDPIKRLKELKTSNSHELELIDVFETKWGPKVESSLHRHFSDFRCEGEWFLLSENQVSDFKSVCEQNHNIFEFMANENSWFREQKQFSKYF